MCNLYRMEKAPDAIIALARELGHEIGFPEGVPNFQPRDVRITERAPILRRTDALELVERRWSWPAPGGKPVFNFRGEGRRFDPAERCVILTDGFYEFTAPQDPKAKKKDRWLFTLGTNEGGHEWFGIAGIYRKDAAVGEAFTMLTCPPGADIEPYHNRQVVVLSPEDCFRWLDPVSLAEDFLKPLPEGSLAVAAA
jgi:putative SOS response-associated peptidase YedK